MSLRNRFLPASTSLPSPFAFLSRDCDTGIVNDPLKIFLPGTGKMHARTYSAIYAAVHSRAEARIPIGTNARVTDVNGEHGGEFKIRE